MGRYTVIIIACGLAAVLIYAILQMRKQNQDVNYDRKSEIRKSIKKDLTIQEQEKEIEELKRKLREQGDDEERPGES